MRFAIACSVLLMLLPLPACTLPSSRETSGVVYVVVRHAEKSQDDLKNPSLSPAGQIRASALGRRFRAKPLVAAYATAYKRTQQTASPAAAASGIDVTTYDASGPASEFATELRRLHTQGTILVVGHSNTVPDIVAAICDCAVAPMDDSDYGRVYEVHVDGARRATLAESRF